MEADELQAIRAARAQELKQEAQSGGGSDGQPSEGQRREADDARLDILASLLEVSARERLARIALVNPSLSTQIEALLVRMAQSGQIRGRVSDTQLLGLLDQIEGRSGSGPKKGGIVFQRKSTFDSDDDDF